MLYEVITMNREHAIFERGRCVAVSPSDTAPALIALDAIQAGGTARPHGIVVLPAVQLTVPLGSPGKMRFIVITSYSIHYTKLYDRLSRLPATVNGWR